MGQDSEIRRLGGACWIWAAEVSTDQAQAFVVWIMIIDTMKQTAISEIPGQ